MPSPMCPIWLQQKQNLSAQLEQYDALLAVEWAACVAFDVAPLTGGPAEQNVNAVQLRIDELIPDMMPPGTPLAIAAGNAIDKYNAWLLTKGQRDTTQAQLNAVVNNLLQNDCPLE